MSGMWLLPSLHVVLQLLAVCRILSNLHPTRLLLTDLLLLAHTAVGVRGTGGAGQRDPVACVSHLVHGGGGLLL